MSFRIACTIFLVISACAFPLYFTVAIGLFSVLWFRNYYELVPIWFLNDILYGVSMHRYLSFPYVMTAAAIILVLLVSYARRHVFDATLQHI